MKNQKNLQYMDCNIPFMICYWDDPVILILKSTIFATLIIVYRLLSDYERKQAFCLYKKLHIEKFIYVLYNY